MAKAKKRAARKKGKAGRSRTPRRAPKKKPAGRAGKARRAAAPGSAAVAAPAVPRPVLIPGAWPFPMIHKP